MPVESDVRMMTDYIWSYWTESKVKPAVTWIELYQLCRYYLEECEKRDMDPQEFSLRDELDPTLKFSESKQHIKELLAVKPSPEEYLESELARMTAGTEFTVVKEKDLEKLLDFEQRVAKLQEQVKKLKVERESETGRKEQALKEVEELRKRPAFKIRILQNFREGIFYYTKGSVVETHNIDWALKKVDEGLAERVGGEVPIKALPEAPAMAIVKPKVPIAGPRDRERYLTDVFIAILSKNNVPIRPEYRARLRIELPNILVLSEKEQETVTEQFSMGIVREYQSKVDILRKWREKAPPTPTAKEEVGITLPAGWKKVEGGYITPNGVFVEEGAAAPPREEVKPPRLGLYAWVYRQTGLDKNAFFKLPKDEQDLLIKQYRGFFPEVRSISLKDWLQETKSITWEEYINLSNEEKAELIDEYAYTS